MNQFLASLAFAISFDLSAQLDKECVYVDPNIIIINCGIEDRYKLAEAVYKIDLFKPKVIALNFIFFDKRRMDSIFIERMTCGTPIVLGMGNGNDSSYFNIDNCFNGPHSITGNDPDNIEFFFPLVKLNQRMRDSYELLVLKFFDSEKYSHMKNYLTSFDLSRLNAKARIEFNGNSLSCFNSIDISDLNKLDDRLIKNKIVILGYFGTNPDLPLDQDKDKSAYKVRAVRSKNLEYMYSTLITANIVSNLIRKEMRDNIKK